MSPGSGLKSRSSAGSQPPTCWLGRPLRQSPCARSGPLVRAGDTWERSFLYLGDVKRKGRYAKPQRRRLASAAGEGGGRAGLLGGRSAGARRGPLGPLRLHGHLHHHPTETCDPTVPVNFTPSELSWRQPPPSDPSDASRGKAATFRQPPPVRLPRAGHAAFTPPGLPINPQAEGTSTSAHR